jgi:hypothetical protein
MEKYAHIEEAARADEYAFIRRVKQSSANSHAEPDSGKESKNVVAGEPLEFQLAVCDHHEMSGGSE